MSCVVQGDSIAVGVAITLRDRCAVVARVGASSTAIARMPLPARRGLTYAVVSAGSNDPDDPRLATTISSIRRRLGVPTIWILPHDRRAAYVVRTVCAAYGDRMVDLASVPSKDGIHPRSYRTLAHALEQARPCT